MDDVTQPGDIEQASATRLAAQHYAQRGWSVIPVPHRSKYAGLKGWD